VISFMQLSQLRNFTYVARLRSFSKAARQLNIAQPALSRQINNLELEFGVKLLLRNTHGVSPTEAGERLVEMSEFIVRYSNEIRDAVVNIAREPTGQVVVGVPPSIAYLIAPTFIAQVRTEFPKVSLRIIEGLSVFLLEWLLYGRVDIAVLTGGEPVKGVQKVHVVDEELVLVGQREKMQNFGTRIPLKALANWPLLITHGFRNVINPAAESVGVPMKFEMELDSLPIIKEMIVKGLGVSILPYATVHRECIQGTLRFCRIDEPHIMRRLYVGVSEFRPAHLTINVIKKVVEAQLKLLPARPLS
jgi:LysR family nitrogen assimilation transcriptional regulator